jgi:P4 family phage/plasmid primase-like protien
MVEYNNNPISLPMTKEIKEKIKNKLETVPEEEQLNFLETIQFEEDLFSFEEDLEYIDNLRYMVQLKNSSEEINKTTSIDMEKDTIKNNAPFFLFEKEAQAKQFIEIQPLFFNKSEMWLIWNKKELKWGVTDKTDILNGIKKIGVNTINSKERTEIINALQQVGREKIPEELDNWCIQFKNKIINVKTEEEFESSSKYFSTNPIPWEIGENEETPTMDKYFEEWVGEEYVKTLYQIIAYASCSNQFMQRMFALVGGGSNGKGTFIKLLKKFIGKDNCVSSEMSLLSLNQFETASLYKKLVCEMGEVSQSDLTNTNQIKKLGGDDEMRYCFKGKTPFTEFSPTTCLINTNSLPHTPDKTIGFYRKWLIVDFPNQFPIKTGIIESIPKKEFENLSKKCIRLLKEMLETQKFENEGNYQERMERYEERSNPILHFIEINCEEAFESYTSLKTFGKYINEYLKNKHLRIMSPKEIKKKLLEEGFDVRRTTKFNITDTYILSLKIKELKEPNAKNNLIDIKNVIKKLSDNIGELISKDMIIGKLIEKMKIDDIENSLLKLKEKGDIFEPRVGLFQLM